MSDQYAAVDRLAQRLLDDYDTRLCTCSDPADECGYCLMARILTENPHAPPSGSQRRVLALQAWALASGALELPDPLGWTAQRRAELFADESEN